MPNPPLTSGSPVAHTHARRRLDTMGVVTQVWLTVLAIAIATAPATASADRIRVAIVPGIAVNLDAARVDALSQDMADALQTELDIDAVGGLEVRRQLPPDGVPPDCVATPACAADVAQRLGASQLLFVVMVDTGAGGAIQIDSTWVEPSTGKSVARPALDLASVSDAKARFAASARTLLPDAPLRTPPTVGGPSVGAMSPRVPRHFTTPAKITTVVAIAGLGVGLGFGFKVRSKYNACDDDRMGCSDSDRDGIRNLGLVADAGWVVAIGATVATAVLFASSGREAALIVEPAPGGGTIGAAGRF